MTEFDRSQLFHQQPQVPNPAADRAAKAFHEAVHSMGLRAYAQAQFFAPVLCACERRYSWTEPSPPQAACVIHGPIQTDHDGRVLVFGIPEHW